MSSLKTNLNLKLDKVVGKWVHLKDVEEKEKNVNSLD